VNVVDASALALALSDEGERGAEARAALAAELPRLTIRKVEVAPLLGRAWELKDNLTPDEAASVADAEHLGAPLITADLRLTRASGPRCEIRGIGVRSA
jgi:predicted nucleic acid-binding protein